MHVTAFSACLLIFIIMSLLDQVSGLASIMGKYGKTVEVPCSEGGVKQEDIDRIKWKCTEMDGSDIDLLIKSKSQNVTYFKTAYRDRIRLTKDFNLQISNVTMADQKTFTCILVTDTDIFDYKVNVKIENAPSTPAITHQAKMIELGKLSTLAECSTKDANPAANIIWLKDNVPLVSDPDGKLVNITQNVHKDTATGLSSTFSKLDFAPTKADMNAKFTCAVQHQNLVSNLVSDPMTFIIHYSSEHVSLKVMPEGPIKEGDNVTLKCAADGNPPPTSYNFHIKEKKVTTENSDTYTLTNITRAYTGEYKCSLVDNEEKAGSASVTVLYLDITTTKGKIVKNIYERFEPSLTVNSTGDAQVSWTKNNVKLNPKFDKLKYSDSGLYECVVSMAGIIKKASFELSVQGPPVITKLTKWRSSGGKLLSCKAEGSPKPEVVWSINGTNPTESSFVNGTVTHNLTVIPTGNFSINCTVYNALGSDTKSIDISTLLEVMDEDIVKDEPLQDSSQAPVAVGIVVGVILIAVIIGLAYWIYMKRTREGTWKTGEKENGTPEESKKLEETPSQKAEV